MTDRRIIDQPRAGYFYTRMVKGGIRVPARIWVEQERHGPRDDDGKYPRREVIYCVIGDTLVDVMQAWPSLRPISEAEWKYLNAAREWAQAHAPHLPEANDRKPVNLGSIPPLF